MKILWLTNIPSPYRVDFFNRLGNHHDLTVLFEKSKSNERENGWEKYDFYNFKGIFLRGLSTGTDSAFCPEGVKYIKSGIYDKIIITNFSDLTGLFSIMYMKINKVPYSIESDGGIIGNEHYLKTSLKRIIIKGAKQYFSTCEKHDEYYLKYGADQKNIVRYPFSSVLNKDIVKNVTSNSEKQIIRKNLGIPIKEKIIVTVGQFIPRKGIDVLIKAAKDINGYVIIIGGVATEEYKQIIEKYDINNVLFLPFMKKSKLFEYIKSSDLFILPTREDIWGLVINESLSQGIPTITTLNCLAGTELIKNGYNGYLYDTENIHELVKYSNIILSLNQSAYNKISQNCLKTARKYTIETMVENHLLNF